MTDDFDLPVCWLRADVYRESIFEPLTRHVIRELLAGIGDAHLSSQMTLLADAISSGAGQIRRINDGSWAWPSQVIPGWAMTTLTRDAFSGKSTVLITIDRALQGLRPA